jgi:hypothetical protein
MTICSVITHVSQSKFKVQFHAFSPWCYMIVTDTMNRSFGLEAVGKTKVQVFALAGNLAPVIQNAAVSL